LRAPLIDESSLEEERRLCAVADTSSHQLQRRVTPATKVPTTPSC